MIVTPVDQLLKNPVSFLDDSGPDDDIAISSRIRLARNIKGYPFPSAASAQNLKEISTVVTAAVKASGAIGKETMYFLPENLSETDRKLLLERRLVSPDFIRTPQNRVLFVCGKENCSLMVNEEDQLRIQTIRPGFQLQEVWKHISKIDDDLGKHLEYAFDEQLGYLTSCPTNVGTGMRASVMLHLPGLVLTDQIASTVHGIGKLHMAVRGIFGEGSDNCGNLFQISNQCTLGESETKIIDGLTAVIKQLILQEKYARRKLLDNDRYAILDNVGRSYGLLRHSYKISFKEAMDCISGLRFGVDMGLFTTLTIRDVNELFIAIGSAHLQKTHNGELSETEIDILRAECCRKLLEK